MLTLTIGPDGTLVAGTFGGLIAARDVQSTGEVRGYRMGE